MHNENHFVSTTVWQFWYYYFQMMMKLAQKGKKLKRSWLHWRQLVCTLFWMRSDVPVSICFLPKPVYDFRFFREELPKSIDSIFVCTTTDQLEVHQSTNVYYLQPITPSETVPPFNTIFLYSLLKFLHYI